MAKLEGTDWAGRISPSLQRRGDEFSVQFSLPEAPRFWARVLLPLTRPILFSDFLLGDLPENEAAEALAAVLRDIGEERAPSIEFTNLGDAGSPEAMDQVARLGRVIDAYVLGSHRFVRLRSVVVDRGKANLRIMFWDQD